MKRLAIEICAIILAVITIFGLIHHISSLNETISIQSSNIKAYEAEVSGLKNDTQTYQYSVNQIKASKDTLIHYLDSLRNVIKIKDKNLKSMSYIKTISIKYDTLYLDKTKTIVNPIDTIVGDDWFNVHLDLHDTVIAVEPNYKSELSVFTSYRKETINPPSKIFFIRWFQKKHKVITVEVIEQNPYAKIEKQKFVEIIKN